MFVVSYALMAQDERYFRQLFSGELQKKSETISAPKYSYVTQTPYYHLDLNQDGVLEKIIFIKKDNEDLIEIFDRQKIKLFSYRFENKGYDSELFRVELRTLSKASSVLLMYYYEGVSKYINFQGTARIYALTIDRNDLKTIAVFKGPSFFDEQKTLKGHYHKKNYTVSLEDLDKDFVKELIVKNNHTSNVFFYRGSGVWKEL